VYVAVVQTKPEPGPEGDRIARASAAKDLPVAEVIAVKSTGSLVDGSDARACGILTGVTVPATDTGAGGLGDATEHRIVGMFDLPENRAGSAEVARHGG